MTVTGTIARRLGEVTHFALNDTLTNTVIPCLAYLILYWLLVRQDSGRTGIQSIAVHQGHLISPPW